MIASVVGMGARGPLGLSVLQVAMGLRAGLFSPRSIKLVDKHSEPIGIGVTGGLAETVYGLERFVQLAAPTLSEAMAELPENLAPTDDRPIPLILCLPEPGRPGHDDRFDGEILELVGQRCGIPLDLEASAVVRRGQPAFAFAVEQARDLLHGGVAAVAVAGVDTYYDPDVLGWLEEGHRLETLEAEDGFIPSEGAACLVLANTGSGSAVGKITDVATGVEPSFGTDDANTGECMTRLMVAVTERRGSPFDWAISDINGERERNNEWDKAAFRALDPRAKLHKWVWEMGDIGAATGPFYTAVALKLCELGAAPQPTGLVAMHAEGADRGVVVFQGNQS